MNKIFNWLFFIVIILVLVAIVIKNWSWISGSFGKKCKESDTPFECIKKRGATLSKYPNAGERYDFGDYGFYSNNRAANTITKLKGSYDKEKITWDAGAGTITLNEVFKK